MVLLPCSQCCEPPYPKLCNCLGDVRYSVTQSREGFLSNKIGQFWSGIACTEEEIINIYDNTVIPNYLFESLQDNTITSEAFWETELPPEYNALPEQFIEKQALRVGCNFNDSFLEFAYGTIFPLSCMQDLPMTISGSREIWKPVALYSDDRSFSFTTRDKICDFANGGELRASNFESTTEGKLFGWWHSPTDSSNIRRFDLGQILSVNIFQLDILRGRTMPTTTTGPGTHLAKTLASWGFKEGKKCSCKKMSRLMDGWGSACAKDPHLTTIVDHLEKEAKKRKLPFVRKLAEALIKRAVRQSENQS